MVPKEDKYKNDMKTKLLDNRTAAKVITGSKATDFLEITGIKFSNFTSITPPAIKKEVEMFMGKGNGHTILVIKN